MTVLSITPDMLPLKTGDRRRWGNLPGSAAALAIATSLQSCTSMCLVIAEDTLTAEKIRNELQFFLDGDCPIYIHMI